MNTELTPVHAILPLPPLLPALERLPAPERLPAVERLPAPERLPAREAPVTTLFLKPVYGITVRHHALTVSVRAHLEAPAKPSARARG